MTLDYGPPNPRPKPVARETRYMNARLRDDSNFWMGFVLGVTVGIMVMLIITFV